MYTTLKHQQGSAGWHAARAQHFCASEAAAAMGVSKYTTRDQLLRQKATGITGEVGAAKQRIFDAGHEAEALARPIAEGIADTEFYPVVAAREVEGMALLASFDGIDLMDEVIWENKLLNQSLVQQVQACDLEPHYWAQLEHQLLVSGAKRALFTTSDGTPDGTYHFWYESHFNRRCEIIAAWKQFAVDLAAYTAPAPKAAPVVAAPMESLPAVSVRLDGKLAVISNLPDFATALREFIQRIPANPDTDQAFANAEAACKSLKRAEDALTAGEDAALGEMVDFEAMRRQVRDLKEIARTARLATEKLVTNRKEQIRGEIVAEGVAALRTHVENLNLALGRHYVPTIPADFGGAVKGKRTVDSLRGAVNDELARAKIAANEIATRIQINLKVLHDCPGVVLTLFADLATLVLKQPDDFALVVTSRMAQHQAAEQARLDAEREKIRAEEVARLAREQEAAAAELAAEQAKKLEVLQAVMRDAEVDAKEIAGMPPSAFAVAPCSDSYESVGAAFAELFAGVPTLSARCDGDHGGPQCADPGCWNGGDIPDNGERLNLGAINDHLAPISLTGAGLSQLGFEPVAVVKASRLYRECDLPAIRAALIGHLNSLELHGVSA